MEPKNGSTEPTAIWITIFLGILKVWLFIFDCLALLPFAIFANPLKKLERSRRLKAKPLVPGDSGSPWRNVECTDGLVKSYFPNVTRLNDIWDRTVMINGPLPCLGTREFIDTEMEKQKNGRIFEKVILGDYQWKSYNEVDNEVKNAAVGLLAAGHKPGQPLVIFSNTCSDWMISALACFGLNVPVVTVYATLGTDAIVHALKETEPATIISSQELAPKVKEFISSCSFLKRVVHFESTNPKIAAVNPDDFQVPVYSLSQLEELGAESDLQLPTGGSDDDLAMIMYTSGTTGLPKGVMITHANIAASTSGQGAAIRGACPDDRYLGYLPLAHILEVGAEFCVLTYGGRIGYSSPLTMHNKASKIKRGTKGDCAVLKPTIMAVVPAIADRIYKAVTDEVAHSSPFMQALFQMMYERKRDKLEHGFDNPFLNRMIYKRIRSILGGDVRIMFSGGAPLSSDTERFINICFCCPVVQGYGLTETCGAGTICDAEDLTTGRVGAPLVCNDIMLRDWLEGKYTVNNEPHPQGEILISGPNVAQGYWKLPDKTAEDFIDIDGRRWFATGDIGEFHLDGSLKIIDRKKDLVKLSAGEYISLGKVETTLVTCPLVENICIYGNSFQNYLVALIVPVNKNLIELAKELGVPTDNHEALCKDKQINKAVLDALVAHGKQGKLDKGEIPAKIHICSEVWTPAMGLLTEALKLKRKPIQDYYQKQLDNMYKK